MRTFATIFVLLAAGAAVYWFMIRPLRKQWAEYARLHSTLSDVDATWWFRIKMSLKGLRTTIFNYGIMITSLILPILEQTGSISVAAFLPPIELGFITITPEQEVLLLAAIVSWINVRLRMVTNTPAGSPVAAAEAVVEVPTVVGKPDVAIVSDGASVVAVADMKAPLATTTETPSVAAVVIASEAGTPVVVPAKE